VRRLFLGALSGALATACSTAAVAQQPAVIRCPEAGTTLRFSAGEGAIVSVGEVGGAVCRYRSQKTQREFNRFLIFDMSSKLYEDNIDDLRTLSPLEVGKSVSLTHSGLSNHGRNKAWNITFTVEKFETVTVLVGRLPAYVIVRDERSTSGHGRWLRRLWYSPVVGYAVKFEFETLAGDPPDPHPRNWELVEIKQP
jgi:hypothetical protein